jgi:hypothetical protein
VSDSSVLDRAVKPKILSCLKLTLKAQFPPTTIPEIASQSQFRQEKARQPPFIKDAGAAVACKSRPFTGSQRNKAWQSRYLPSLRVQRGNPVPSHALHRHPHLLIREKKVCGDAGEPMRAVLLGRSGFGVQAVKKPNMIGFKP